MKLLTNKTLVTNAGSWYAPRSEFFNKYKSIVDIVFTDTTSSAGDWHGFIVQKVGKRSLVAIGFSQYNNYPEGGFTFTTCEHPFYRVKNVEKERDFIHNMELCWNQFDNLAI